MNSLVTVERGAIIQRVTEVLSGFPGVAGAYLFGSALGKCRPDSDIDIALVLEDLNLSARERDLLESEIAACFVPLKGHSFDITLLNPENIIFCYQVLREGILIYERNHERVTDVKEIVSRRAVDLYPRYRAAMEEIIAEVMEDEC